jgi:hypothetical protein
VARDTGARKRGNRASEAVPTTWRRADSPARALLARALPWSRKKLPFDAPKVGPPAECETRVELPERPLLMGGRNLAWIGGQYSDHTLALPGNERGEEPSKAYRQDLQQRDDATCANLGTPSGPPATGWANLRLSPDGGRSPRSSRRSVKADHKAKGGS